MNCNTMDALKSCRQVVAGEKYKVSGRYQRKGGGRFMLPFLPLLLQLAVVVISNWPSQK